MNTMTMAERRLCRQVDVVVTSAQAYTRSLRYALDASVYDVHRLVTEDGLRVALSRLREAVSDVQMSRRFDTRRPIGRRAQSSSRRALRRAKKGPT